MNDCAALSSDDEDTEKMPALGARSSIDRAKGLQEQIEKSMNNSDLSCAGSFEDEDASDKIIPAPSTDQLSACRQTNTNTMATTNKPVSHRCAAYEFCQGYAQPNEKLQHQCKTCTRRVHSWCIGWQDEEPELHNGYECAKCFKTDPKNKDKPPYTEEALKMKQFTPNMLDHLDTITTAKVTSTSTSSVAVASTKKRKIKKRIRLRGQTILASYKFIQENTTSSGEGDEWFIFGAISSTVKKKFLVTWNKDGPYSCEGEKLEGESVPQNVRFQTQFPEDDLTKAEFAASKERSDTVTINKNKNKKKQTRKKKRKVNANATMDEDTTPLRTTRRANFVAAGKKLYVQGAGASSLQGDDTPARLLDRWHAENGFNHRARVDTRNRRSDSTRMAIEETDADLEQIQINELERGDYDPTSHNMEYSLDGDETGSDQMMYKFRDDENVESFPDLQCEDDQGGDGGIPAALEEDGDPIIASMPDLSFVYEDPEVAGYGQWEGKSRTINWAPFDSKLIDSIPTKTWDSALNCYFHVSGFDIEQYKDQAQVMTEYALQRKNSSGRFAGTYFVPFQYPELIVAEGIILKISLDGRKRGGYEQYWTGSSTVGSIGIGEGRNVTIDHHEPWAKDFMTLTRFRQFLAAYRLILQNPLGVADKAAHLRKACTSINIGAKRTFILGQYVSIDEAGVASRSRMNPIRQYNKDKPSKYRVDFFSMNCPRRYFTYNIEPYQGKNASETFVHLGAKGFPTTQKAILNSILNADIQNSSDGSRILAVDNRYGAPILAVVLRDLYRIYIVCTMRKNRKGWDKEEMDMEKSAERSATKLRFDKVNGILAGQWRDNKVVSFLLTVPDEYGMETVKRRVGRNINVYCCPRALKTYQENMGGTDNFDQIRECGGGGLGKGIRKFHKWFKTPCLALKDTGIANSSIAWNMKAETVEGTILGVHARPIFRFQTVLASQMMNFKCRDERSRRGNGNAASTYESSTATEFSYEAISELTSTKFPQCKVCSLEEKPFIHKKALKIERGKGSRSQKYLYRLVLQPDNNKHIFLHQSNGNCHDDGHHKIFSLPSFQGMACNEIYHSEKTKGLWQNGCVQNKHHIYQTLKEQWDLVPAVSDR